MDSAVFTTTLRVHHSRGMMKLNLAQIQFGEYGTPVFLYIKFVKLAELLCPH